jgi:FkbM family methyltransferase
MGWRGINLDAMPGSMDAFARKRPRDINLEVAIAEAEGVLTYHAFSEPALNTFSAPLAETYRAIPGVRLLRTTEIACRRLATVLDEALPPGTPIDLLSVDVEGLDLEVLRSNDWSRFRPDVVLVESLDAPDLAGLAGDATARFLSERGYAPIAKTVNTLFFRDRAPR